MHRGLLATANGRRQFGTRGSPDVNRQCNEEWLGWEDSNLRMAIPKTAALPLGYTPFQSETPPKTWQRHPTRLAQDQGTRLLAGFARSFKSQTTAFRQPEGANAQPAC